MSIINVRDLSCGYEKDKPVLANINLDIDKSEFLGIIGPNGAGKTTLLKSLSGILAPFSGEMTLEGRDIYKMSLLEIARSFAFVSSDVSITFPFSVLDVVLMGRTPYLRRIQGYSEQDMNIAKEALGLTDCLQFMARPIYALSAGERQRVFIAKMLAQQPRVVFLDEPTTHLDIGHQIEILNLLKKFNQEKQLTLIIIMHDLNLASEYCNRLILLNDGAIEKDGSPQDVLTYELIEKVYNTLVVVSKNPISGKPHILLVTDKKEQKIFLTSKEKSLK